MLGLLRDRRLRGPSFFRTPQKRQSVKVQEAGYLTAVSYLFSVNLSLADNGIFRY